MRMRSASWILVAQLANVLISLLLSVLLARELGAPGKGTVSIVLYLGVTGAALANLGFNTALTYLAARREVTPRDAVTFSGGLALAVTGAALLLTIPFGLPAARALLHSDSVGLLRLGVLAIAPSLFGTLLGAYLIGANRVRQSNLITVGSMAFQLAADLVLAALHLLVPLSAVLVWLAAISGGAAGMWWQARRVGADRESVGALGLFRKGYRYGLSTWASSVLGMLALRQDVFLVALLLDTKAVGVYSIAVAMAETAWYMPAALNNILMPKVAGSPEDTVELTQRLTRVAWPVTVGVAIVVVLVSRPLLPLVFGEVFSASLLPLVLLTPGMVAGAIASMPSAYVMGIGRPLDWTRACLANITVNLLANILLIPRLGVLGAAVASSLSYWVSAVIVCRYFLSRSNTRLKDLVVPRRSDFVGLFMAVRSAIAGRSAAT
jgi:O-antigen/teichoic acid export membrane protein